MNKLEQVTEEFLEGNAAYLAWLMVHGIDPEEFGLHFSEENYFKAIQLFADLLKDKEKKNEDKEG